MHESLAKDQAQIAGAVLGNVGHDSTENLAAKQFYTANEILAYLTEDEKRNLQQEVINTINNELVHAEGLELILPRLLGSCHTESMELRRAMNSIASSQIVEVQRALQIIKETYTEVSHLQNLFLKQRDLIADMGSENKSYQQLRQLQILQSNVGAVIEWSLALKEVRYENLYTVIQKRQFVSMYKRLERLQRIRRTVIAKAGAQYSTFQVIFEAYFSKLDTVLALFVQEIYAVLSNDAMDAAIQKALADTSDENAVPGFVALRECMLVCSEEIEHPLLNFWSNGMEQTSQITIEKIQHALCKNVAKLWEEQIMVDVVDALRQVSVFLEQIKKVDPLLEALELTLIPLTNTFSFFGMVVRALHDQVMNVMKAYIDPNAGVDANCLIQASQFIRWYREMLINGNYVQYVDLSSIDDMVAAFMTAAVDGLTEHLTRLCRACAIATCNDPKSQTILPSGHPITAGPVDMFAVLQQTLNGLTASIETPVMWQIGKACADAMYAYLDECRQRSDFDYCEEENARMPIPHTPEVWEQRRLLCLYAFINDCATIENNLDTIEGKFLSCWRYDGSGLVEGGEASHDDGSNLSPFQRVQDALTENVFYYLDEITSYVEKVVDPQWALVFRQGAWYETDANPIQFIVETISNFIEDDFSVMLQLQRQRKIIRQTLIRFVQKYISTCMEFLASVIRSPKKNVVEDWNSFIDCVMRDMNLSMSMWKRYHVDTPLIELATKALDLLKSLLSVNKAVDFNFILQEKMLDDFGDCPTFVIRFVLEARQKEVDKETRERMLIMWEESTAYQKRDKKTDLPTTGWSQPPSFFGSLDPGLAGLDKATRFFGKSAKKKREEEQALKSKTEKDAKRAARREQREKDAAATTRKQPVHITDLRSQEIERASF